MFRSNIGYFQQYMARSLFGLVPSNSANVIAKPHAISQFRNLCRENAGLERLQIRTAVNNVR